MSYKCGSLVLYKAIGFCVLCLRSGVVFSGICSKCLDLPFCFGEQSPCVTRALYSFFGSEPYLMAVGLATF